MLVARAACFLNMRYTSVTQRCPDPGKKRLPAIESRSHRTTFVEPDAEKRAINTRVNVAIPRFADLAILLIAGSTAGSLVCPSLAQSPSRQGSAVTGLVRDRAGQPQVGALIELLNAHSVVIAHTFTDDHGRYALPRLGAGTYQLRASSTLFLPAVQPNLRLITDSRVIVNLTLSTLYQAMQWLPAEPRQAATPDDDWSWTLRFSANRPLLRMLDPATAQQATVEPPQGRSRQLVLHSGLPRFGEGGTAQQVVWTARETDTRSVLLAASAAWAPDGLERVSTSAAYRQDLSPDRSMLTVLTVADRPSVRGEGSSLGTAGGLMTVRVRSASTVRLGDLAEVSAGTELEAARLGEGTVAAGSHPFAEVRAHAGRATLSYSVATSPAMTGVARLDEQASGDAPMLVRDAGTLRFEQGLHQQVGLRGEAGSWTGELGVFQDALEHPLVEGSVRGAASGSPGQSDVLYDPGTGTIAVSGEGYSGGGVLAMLRDQLSPDTWFSLRYALGEAVALPAAPPAAAGSRALPAFTAHRSAMVSASAQARLPETGTVVRGSYRWQPTGTLTQVAPFEGGVPDAYLGLLVRQPLHMQRVGVGKLDAILDVRNLLAQGYRPFLSEDGTTMYFAQAQRCIAAGFSLSF